MFTGKKLGLLLSTLPEHARFGHGVALAARALSQGIDVYIYCIDDAVVGVGDDRLQQLKARGLKLFACAYGAHRRNIPLSEAASFAGLTIVSDIMAATDRFVCF
jgi:predicted peroxiredoxin